VIAALEQAIAAGQRRQKASARGQIGLFEAGGSHPEAVVATAPVEAPEVPARQLLTWEKELLGFYLSDHPLSAVLGGTGSRPAAGLTQIVELSARTPGEKVRLVAMITGVRRITTKTNRTMAIVELEDLTGTIELVAFPECYERFAGLWEPDAILEVVAKLERRNEALQLVCETATAELTAATAAPPARRTVHVRLPASADVWNDIRLMQHLDAVLRRHEGDDALVLHLPRRSAGALTLRSRSRRVDWNELLRAELVEVVGETAVKVDEPEPIPLAS
jgi:DNA polymerase-3 subunit alpha